MVSVQKIYYVNSYSDSFFGTNKGLITSLAFEGDSGDTDTFLARESVGFESWNGKSKRVSNYKYTDKFKPTFTFIKDDFTDFTIEEQRKLLKWLTAYDTPSVLTVYSHELNTGDNVSQTYYIMGAFTSIQAHKMGSGRVVGFVAEFESIYPYAYKSIRNMSISNGTIINIESDENQLFIYPKFGIDITTGEGKISITNKINNYTEWKSEISNCKQSTHITLDGMHKEIDEVQSGYITHRVFGSDFNWIWVPLGEGQNKFTIAKTKSSSADMDIMVDISYNIPIKLGEFLGGF